MRSFVVRLLCLGAVCISLSACGGSKPTIAEPVGRVQLGMTIEEVTSVLGSGQVVEPGQHVGAHAVEVREFPSGDGRIYVVRFVDGLVRRWELQTR